MLQTTIKQITDFMIGAIARSNGGGGARVFLIEDKKKIVEMVRDCALSQSKIAKHLSQHWDDYQKWLGRFNVWGVAYNKGQLNIERAVAVQRPKPQPQPQPIDSFKLLIEHGLRGGKSIQDIVDRAFEVAHAWKVERANDTLGDVEALLKSKGLSLDDLKKVL